MQLPPVSSSLREPSYQSRGWDGPGHQESTKKSILRDGRKSLRLCMKLMAQSFANCGIWVE